jgi:hypothetical protein
MRFERTFPGAEHVRAVTTQHDTNKATAMSGAAYDLLDRDFVLPQLENGGIGLLATKIALILDWIRCFSLLASPTFHASMSEHWPYGGL